MIEKESVILTKSEKEKNKESISNKKRALNLKMQNDIKKIELLEELQEQFEEINKTVEKCIELMSFSATGELINDKYENMYEDNRSFYTGIMNTFDNDINDLKKNIMKSLDMKTKLDKDSKEEK